MSICAKLRNFKDLTLILRKASKIKERMQVDEGRIRNFDVTFDTIIIMPYTTSRKWHVELSFDKRTLY